MVRKIALGVAAVAALGIGSLAASAPASAKGFHGGGFHGGHFHGGGFRFGVGVVGANLYDSCYRNILVTKRNGDVVVRTVNVCI